MKLFKRQRLQAAGTETTTDNEPVVDPNSLSVPERLDFLQKEIDQLQQRNFEKDRGKEFESSYTRVIFLMVVTYWTLFGYMSIIKTANPFLDAIVPTVRWIKGARLQQNNFYRCYLTMVFGDSYYSFYIGGF